MSIRVDFYQLSRDPVDVTVAKLAAKALQAGERLLVVAGDDALREKIGTALWSFGNAHFLANGPADGLHAERQPILLGEACEAVNGARIALIADGQWRAEAERFERVMLLFDEQATEAARDLWRELDPREDIDNRIHKQTPQGGWREGR